MIPDYLVCPETKQSLAQMPLAEAEELVGGDDRLVARADPGVEPFGPTPTVLVREDRECAYPVVDGVPVLLLPEVLVAERQRRSFDLSEPRYAEAYEEMAHYNAVAEGHERLIRGDSVEELERSSSALRTIAAIRAASEEERARFPYPFLLWVDAPHDSAAQFEAYEHLAPVRGRRLVQLGGEGAHAVKFLLAGAAEAVILSPMIRELGFARALAEHHGVGDRLSCVAAIAEELPFADATFDGIYAGGCVHHMVTELALPESARVLRPGGRFAAIEPWRAPFYALGTRVFGKSEPNVYCRPLTQERVEPLFTAFDQAELVHHGALTRYPLKALERLGVRPQVSVTAWIARADDRLASLVPPLRRIGSSVALLATRS